MNLLPGLARIDGFEQPAFLVWAIKSSECADVDDIGVLRMDDDSANLIRSRQALVLPRFSAIGGEVDAIAIGDGVARVGFAGADPDDVAIRRCDSDGPDRNGFLPIKLMLERGAVVDRLEQPARCRGDVPGARVGFKDRESGDASAHVRRADRSPGEDLCEIRLWFGRLCAAVQSDEAKSHERE